MILSDRQIKNLCLAPSYQLFDACNPNLCENIAHPMTKAELEDLRSRQEHDPNQNWDPLARLYREVSPEAKKCFKPMITPFISEQVRAVERKELRMGNWEKAAAKIISKGLSSFGYDVTLAPKARIFTNANSTVIDPKNLDENCLTDAVIHTDPETLSKYFVIPPNSYALGSTVEKFDIPNNITVIALGKSTYARAGAIINVTPVEAGFPGEVVIEIANTTPLPMRIYVMEGIAQFLFLRGNEDATVPYGPTRKYYGQTGITLPKV